MQRVIDSITEDIEAMQGKLNLWNSLIAMATLELNIRQEDDPLLAKRETKWNALSGEDMVYLIKSGFFGVLNAIVSFLQWLVIFVVGYSPIWLILIAVIALGSLIYKRLQRRKQNKE